MVGHGACSRCGESLDGDEIPGLRGRRADLRIGIELSYAHRGTALVWRCPFCGYGWPRFDTGPMHDVAVRHLRAEDQARYEKPVTGAARARRPTRLPEVDPDERVEQVARAGSRPVPKSRPGVHQDAGASLLPHHHRS